MLLRAAGLRCTGYLLANASDGRCTCLVDTCGGRVSAKAVAKAQATSGCSLHTSHTQLHKQAGQGWLRESGVASLCSVAEQCRGAEPKVHAERQQAQLGAWELR